MNSIRIKQIVASQLLEKGIEDYKIYILEKPFGYVVQMKYKEGNGNKYLNEIFDKDGNTIYPLSQIKKDSGPIYETETCEIIDYKRKKTY